MKIALKDIKPNPYRNLERYPLDQPHVDELVASIKATEAGFWDNVLVRKVGDKYELAYGHHRLEAAKQAGLKEADFIVKKLSDEEMLKIMYLENKQDRVRKPFISLMESVEAAVKAIAQGTILVSIPNEAKITSVRLAPSFRTNPIVSRTSEGVPPSGTPTDGVPYNTPSLAIFLGETKKHGDSETANEAISAVINALELMERKALTRREVEAIPTLDALQRRVGEAQRELEQRERQRLARQRDEEALAEAAKRVKEAQEKRKLADKKAAEEQEKIQERIREEAEKIRLAQEEKRQAETAAEKARAVKAIEEARRRQAEEEERAKEREKEFKKKRAELDAAVEARKHAEEAKKEWAEERATKAEEPRIPREEPEKYSETEVFKAWEKAADATERALEMSRATRQKDLLMLKRTKGEIERVMKAANKGVVKYQKA
jgi:chromosome segregation ATPase